MKNLQAVRIDGNPEHKLCTNREKIVIGVQKILEKEYHTALSLNMIAERYNISVSYLAHIFREITGISLMRCLLLIRVREAKRYLEQTNLRVNIIAKKCGFNDVTNFGRTFRKETGCTPKQYRREHTSSGENEENM